MQRRIAMWAAAGVVVACGWGLAAMLSGPSTWSHATWRFAEITYPVSLLRTFRLSVYLCVLINAATYALLGLAIELVSRSPARRLSS